MWLVGEAGPLLVAPGGQAGPLLLRARARAASCRPRTASPTCCWRCAPTRRASRPWPTTPSRGAPWRLRRRLRRRSARRSTRPRGQLASPRSVAWNVVIAGGGFGGLYAARRLERVLPRHSARITLVSDDELPALHAAAARGRGGHARAAPRGGAAARGARLGRRPARSGDRRRPGAARAALVARVDGRERDAALRPADRGAGLGLAHAAGPGLAEHGLGFKTLRRRRSRCATARCCNLEIAESLDDPEQRREYLTFVFVGAGYAGRRGDRGAAGLRRRRDRPLPALPHRRHALGPGRGAGPDDAGDPPSLAEFATRELRGRGIEIRTGTRLDAVDGGRRDAVDRRAHPHPLPVLDRRRQAAAGRARARPAAERGRPDRGRPRPAREGPRERLGDRRRRRRARPRRSGASARARRPPSTRCARAACVADNVAAALGHGRLSPSATRRAACSWTWASTRPWPPCSGVRLRGLPGLVRRADLPPADDAGLGRRAAPGGRLDRRPVLRPRLGRARPARPSRGPRRRSRGRAASRDAVPSRELMFREGRPGRPRRHVRAGRARAARRRRAPGRQCRRAPTADPTASRTHWRSTARWSSSSPPSPRAATGLRGATASWSGFARVVAVRRDGGAHRADGRPRATRAGASAGRCWSAAGRATPRPTSGRVVVAAGAPADLTLCTPTSA